MDRRLRAHDEKQRARVHRRRHGEIDRPLERRLAVFGAADPVRRHEAEFDLARVQAIGVFRAGGFAFHDLERRQGRTAFEQRLERAALAIEGAVALGGADPDRHEREPRPFSEIAEPIFVAEAAAGVSSPAVSAEQRRRRARFPCRPRGRRLTKKVVDVREDAG